MALLVPSVVRLFLKEEHLERDGGQWAGQRLAEGKSGSFIQNANVWFSGCVTTPFIYFEIFWDIWSPILILALDLGVKWKARKKSGQTPSGFVNGQVGHGERNLFGSSFSGRERGKWTLKGLSSSALGCHPLLFDEVPLSIGGDSSRHCAFCFFCFERWECWHAMDSPIDFFSGGTGLKSMSLLSQVVSSLLRRHFSWADPNGPVRILRTQGLSAFVLSRAESLHEVFLI